MSANSCNRLQLHPGLKIEVFLLPSEAKRDTHLQFHKIGVLNPKTKSKAPNRGRTGDLRMIASCNPTLYH